MECESRFGVTDVYTKKDFTGVNDVESCEGHEYHTGAERQGCGKGMGFGGRQTWVKAHPLAEASEPKLLSAP